MKIKESILCAAAVAAIVANGGEKVIKKLGHLPVHLVGIGGVGHHIRRLLQPQGQGVGRLKAALAKLTQLQTGPHHPQTLQLRGAWGR